MELEVIRAHLASARGAFIVLGELTNFLSFILVPPDAIASEILVIALSSWFTSKFMVGSRALNVCRNMPLLLGVSCWVHGEMPVSSSVLE